MVSADYIRNVKIALTLNNRVYIAVSRLLAPVRKLAVFQCNLPLGLLNTLLRSF